MMTKEQALAILELHKTQPQPVALLQKAVRVASAIIRPTG